MSVNSTAPGLTAKVRLRGKVQISNRVRVEVMVRARVKVSAASQSIFRLYRRGSPPLRLK